MSETEEAVTTPAFNEAGLLAWLDDASPGALDAVGFGIIGMDADGIVTVYNDLEARLAGLRPDRVLGRSLFGEVAPCMDNDLVDRKSVV